MLTIAFVDPFISPDEIGTSFKNHNIRSVGIFQRHHVQNCALKNRFKPDPFDQVIYIEPEDTLETSLEKIKTASVDYLFNGFDISSPLTDQLANQLHPTVANNLKTSLARYDKIASQNMLSAAGIKVPRYMEITTSNLTADKENKLRQWNFPLILKPTNASGTNGFFECNNLAEVRSKLQSKISNHLGYAVTSYLLQEKLIGDEYAIDTFSWQGKHHLIHIRKYQKEYINGLPISRQAHAILPTEKICSEITDYFYKVLDTVELRNGFCHAEIFVTQNGLFLIDINPRIPGGNNASCILAKETYGYSHLDILSHLLQNKPLNMQYQFGKIIYLQNLTPRVIDKVDVNKLKNLPSFKYCLSSQKEGTFLRLPQNLWDTVAYVVLAHPNLQQLEADCEKIFVLERNQELF
jgi:D-alanine-D-alanine ligase-like ATP-grasp enzyme